MTDLGFYLKQLQPLVGGRIVRLAQDSMGEFYGLVVAKPDGKETAVLFLSDDEGNGPGSFEMVDV